MDPHTETPQKTGRLAVRPARDSERGMSLLEVSVTLLLMSMVMSVFYEMILAGMRTSMFAESHSDLSSIGQRAVNSVHMELIQAKLIFQEDTLGAAYRDRYVTYLPGGVSVAPNSRMPIIDSSATVIGTDPGPNNITNRTGNSLLVVRQLTPITVPWDHDANVNTADVNFLADQYQFEYYFLRRNTTRSFGGLGYYLEVMMATSQVFADYAQINDITTNKAQIAAGARSVGGNLMAWDPGKSLATPAFYNISVAGALSSNTTPAFTLSVKSLFPDFAGGRVSGAMEYSIAPNPTASITFKDPVPLYATSGSGFPNGLEFQIVGQSGTRLIATRMVLAANYNNNFSSQEAAVKSSARGF